MDERIDIEVIDKVAKSIKPELLGISAAAKNAYTQIAKLKKELGVTGGSGIASATKAAASAERDATRASAERARQASTTARAIDAERIAMDRLRATAARASVNGVRAGSGANLGVAAGSRSTMAAQTAIMRQTSVANREVAATAKEAAVAQNTFATSTAKAGQQAGLARHHLLNLGFQLQDIFVSLASGQKPMTVFIQQGGQIGQIAAQSGVGFLGMAKAIGGVLARFAPLAIGAAAVAGSFSLFNHQLNKENDMKKFAESLGLTAKEIKKLDDVTITWGDTASAVFEVGVSRIASAFGINVGKISSLWNSMLSGLWTGTKNTFAAIYAVAAAGFDIIRGKISLDPIGDLKRRFADATKFIDDVGKKASDNAKKRIKTQASEIISNRPNGPKGSKSDAERLAERQAEALRKLRAELGKEQKLLAQNLVGIDATIAERMNSIADSLEGVKIDIFADQYVKLRTEIEGLVSTIEKEKVIVGAMKSQYDEASKTELDYATNTEALNRLIAKGGDYMDNYKNQLNSLQEAYLDAIDPLRAFNRELDEQSSTLFKMGDAKSIQEYVNSIANTYRDQKKGSIFQQGALNDNGDIVVNGARKLLPEVQAQVDAFAEYLKEQKLSDIVTDIFSSGAGRDSNQFLIDNYKELYAAIDQMRTGDVRSEEQAARAKQELNLRYNEARVQGVSDMFGQLTSLQDSSVRELAAIGKAAALAQATIDGVLAVQKALAQGGPLGIGLAIATGVAAAANVAKIAGIGFQKGGYTGDYPAHQSVGAVHGREYVMDAASTARIGVPTLEAMRNGRLNPAPAANNNAPKVTVINNAGAAIQVREHSDGELEIMIDNALERKMGPTFERRLSNPNSRESRAIGTNFTTRRNRG